MQLKLADNTGNGKIRNSSDGLPHRHSGRLSPPGVSAACPRPVVSSVGVFLKLGPGWFGGVITRRVHRKSRRDSYDYRVILQKADTSTRSMKLPLESYSTNEGARVGAWVLLEIEQREEVRPGRSATPKVRNTETSTR